ncbi:hypothetical protein X474_25030 [Dethiosulfatarculus sandiegensis]|uniref:Radical SAM core domain-containing protein n=1 Tax=Dethiosulfatarculus sandiegensis TaxID=1429043 RepID=A0A0D2G9H4_9BACT|nr:hypothetical protein X474_25030 [Dethiosulfatarculus sandiegensis]
MECTLCPQACQVEPGSRGACRVRQNIDGKYYTLVYGNPCAVHLDPIEKKPFFHVLPGTLSYSLATAGCNFSCLFCQNWEISQKSPDETINQRLSPQNAVDRAKYKGAASVASTYVEPTIFMEYMLDLGRECRQKGLLKVMHSNGFVNPEPFKLLAKVLDAACIDLKSMNEDFYQKVCGGELGPVKDTLVRLHKAGIHTEIVHLMIPTLNDGLKETKALIRFVRDELSPETPVHFTRFHPQYKLLNLPPTPVNVLDRAQKTARSMGLSHAYVGNVPGHPAENTYCPNCGNLLIKRVGYHLVEQNITMGKCPRCGHAIKGIWSLPGEMRAKNNLA